MAVTSFEYSAPKKADFTLGAGGWVLSRFWPGWDFGREAETYQSSAAILALN